MPTDEEVRRFFAETRTPPCERCGHRGLIGEAYKYLTLEGRGWRCSDRDACLTRQKAGQ